MGAEIIPRVSVEASAEEVVDTFNRLSDVLSRVLVAGRGTGIDRTNIRRRGVSLGKASGVAGNIDGMFVTFTTSATPDAENTVTHNLGRIPVGYIVTDSNKAGVVYSSSKGSWTAATMRVKCNVASTTVTLLVF